MLTGGPAVIFFMASLPNSITRKYDVFSEMHHKTQRILQFILLIELKKFLRRLQNIRTSKEKKFILIVLYERNVSLKVFSEDGINKQGGIKATLSHLVGKTGFEPATPWSQTRCATGLRYFPNIF